LKATGIVRRIDDLGRVVIPKEIRRTMRIREGDPLEIFTDREGEVILKKYSPIGELNTFALEYAESLSITTGHVAIICDRDAVIAVAGSAKRDYMDRALTPAAEEVMENRRPLLRNPGDRMQPLLQGDDTLGSRSLVLCPIVSGGDAVGLIMLAAKDGTPLSHTEQKLCETAAVFLAKQMES